MIKVVITVENGMVQDVLSNADIEVQVIDWDTTDEEEFKEAEKQIEEAWHDPTMKPMY